MTTINNTHAAGMTGSYFSRLADSVRYFASIAKARRDLKRISELDDHMLEDIGLTRSNIHEAQLASLAVDPMILLIQASRSR